MIRFILLTLAILAWAFWALSGGSDFVPELAPPPEPATAAAPRPAEETRAPAATPPAPAPVPEPEPAPEPQPDPQPEPQPQTAPQPAEPAPTAAPEPERTALDIRLIGATRVNMRSGPSTDYRVVDTLSEGTAVEVMEIDTTGAEPWARISVLSTNLEGWMAERFLVVQ